MGAENVEGSVAGMQRSDVHTYGQDTQTAFESAQGSYRDSRNEGDLELGDT